MEGWHFTGIFCDDFRQEINGKVSLIGCYATEMVVREIPLKLPKLVAFFSCTAAYESIPSEGELSISIIGADDKPIGVRASIPLESVNARREQADSGENNKVRIQGAIDMPFFAVESETTIRLVACINNEEVEIETLTIKLAPNQAQEPKSP